MGCDGGTIPRRDELVKTKKKPEQKDKNSELLYKWRHCALTQEALAQPIVTCGLGRLYNKQAIIEALLSKSLSDTFSHIKSLKDIKDLKLVANPSFKSDNETSSPYICPITGLEMTGRFRFICLWSCGCVLAERALKELKTHQCVTCQQSFTETDIVILNGTDDDLEVMKTRMLERKQKQKERSRMAKKDKIEASGSNENETATSNGISKKINNKRSATAVNDLKSIHDPVFKKAKDEYSVAKDPNASEVFKSIFTSHETEKKQDRAHWITYNPFYN